LYLVTAYGQVLALEPSRDYPTERFPLYLYQEIAPVHPRIVSTETPQEFYQFITKNPDSLVHLPAICFVDLELGLLAEDPEYGDARDLPYMYIDHLRECLMQLKTKTIQHKIVNRVQSVEFPYRMIKTGIFVGTEDELVYFPMPPREELRGKYYRWWRSANM
jgi:hypothetical protein